MNISSLRIGYAPYSNLLNSPGDSRRFVQYAKKRNINFEIANYNHKYDIVILTENSDISLWSKYKNGKIVYDLIDSYLSIPRNDAKGLLRGVAKFVTRQSKYPQFNHWKAIELMCTRSDAVVCSTEEQRALIIKHCKNVHIILDSHDDITRNKYKINYKSSTPFRLVWEGLPHTISSLNILIPILSKLCKFYPIELIVVTDPYYFKYMNRFWKSSTVDNLNSNLKNISLVEWNANTIADIVCSCDLGIIPINLKDPFSFGKPANKLFLFWRFGLPVLTSPSPAYSRAMSDVGIDMTCLNEKQWELSIENFINSEYLRKEAGSRVRHYVEEKHGLDENLNEWDCLFNSLFNDC